MAASSSSPFSLSDQLSLIECQNERNRVSWVLGQITQRPVSALDTLTTKQLREWFEQAAAFVPQDDPDRIKNLLNVGQRFHRMPAESGITFLKWSFRKMYCRDFQIFVESAQHAYLTQILLLDRLPRSSSLIKRLNQIEAKVNTLLLEAPQRRAEKKYQIIRLEKCRTRLLKVKSKINELQSVITLHMGLLFPLQLKRRIGVTSMDIYIYVYKPRNKQYFTPETLKALNPFHLSPKRLGPILNDEQLAQWKMPHTSALIRIDDEEAGLMKKIRVGIQKLSEGLSSPAQPSELDEMDRIIQAAERLALLFFSPTAAREKLKLAASDWEEISKEVLEKGVSLEILRGCKTEAEFLEVTTHLFS